LRSRRRVIKLLPEKTLAGRPRVCGDAASFGAWVEKTMTDAVIVSTARTALTKSWRGAFNLTHGATLGGHVVKHAVERARI